jgi:hypothetical protein
MPELSNQTALTVWLHLGEKGCAARLEREYRYLSAEKASEYAGGKEPVFYRVRVPIRHIGERGLEEVLAIAKTYEAKVGFGCGPTGEPFMEML